MKPVVVALTKSALETATRGAEAVGGELHIHDKDFANTASHLRGLFTEGRPIVGICAAGILIRILAPLLADKREEPPVIAVSEDGASIVPLLGGHRGANDLARKLAEALGGHAAITTAGDNRFGVALDAPPEGWTLANPEDAKPVMAALLAGGSARLDGDAPWLAQSRIVFAPEAKVRLVATTRDLAGDSTTLIYHARRLAIGIGCERNADPEEAIGLVRRALREAGLAPASVALVASIDLKADEPAVLEVASELGVSARFFGATALETETPRLKNPSEAVFREVGCHGVAEGAALAAVGVEGKLVVAKQKSARVTCAIAEAPVPIDPASVGRARGKLAIVGIGPGSAEWLTPEARHLLETSEAVVGYSLYLNLVAPLIAHAERFDSALGSEEARVRQALSLAAEGRNVALVSSGDAGIYAMASLAFEVLDTSVGETFSQREKVAAEQPDEGMRGLGKIAEAATPHPPASRAPSPSGRGLTANAARIELVVAPGISAMQAAAARAGAPLGHDFCAISLSDLLTPWETIEARIRAAAESDFVIAFYNPVSERRRTQLVAARDVLLQHRPRNTPVVLARNLGREGERVITIPLENLEVDMVDMLTLVMVGASTTRQVDACGRVFTYTPRGYDKKRGGEVDASPPLRGRDGGGGKASRSTLGNPSPQGGGVSVGGLHASPLPDPPPQGGRE